jgi:glutaminyl-peptide cyclotransferase
MLRRSIAAAVAAALLIGACSRAQPDGPAPVCGYEVVEDYPHDPEAYTQGLVFEGGRLFEGTGIHGRSTLREVDLRTGRVVRSTALAEEHFGEGVTLLGDTLFQLTWQSEEGFTYDADTLMPLGGFAYEGEGWGLTHDGTNLILSDGTAGLRFLDPSSFGQLRQLDVTDDGKPVERLNELEHINGEIWANVWQTDTIARIDPATGRVRAWVDLTGLLSPEQRTPTAEVLNGIAYDAEGDRIFVTGKFWPRLFQIRISGC